MGSWPRTVQTLRGSPAARGVPLPASLPATAPPASLTCRRRMAALPSRRLMSSIFQTPVALITLITEDRVWFKASPGAACRGAWAGPGLGPVGPGVGARSAHTPEGCAL